MRKHVANATENKSCILLIFIFYPQELAQLFPFRRDSIFVHLNQLTIIVWFEIHYQPILKDHKAPSTFAAQDEFFALSHPLLNASWKCLCTQPMYLLLLSLPRSLPDPGLSLYLPPLSTLSSCHLSLEWLEQARNQQLRFLKKEHTGILGTR